VANHRFKSSYGQCRCLWCFYRGGDCPVTNDMRMALKKFAMSNGRTWKAALRTLWTTGRDEDLPLLRQCRNVIGPNGLDRISPKMLASVTLEA
jgi:hypothetical protein